MSIEATKDRIRKLLRVSQNDAATRGEIENAIRAARNMMHAHHLTEEDVGDLNQDSDPPPFDPSSLTYTRSAVAMSSTRPAPWEKTLSAAVCEIVGSVEVYWSNRRMVQDENGDYLLRNGKYLRATHAVFYGSAEDVSLAVELYTDLLETIRTMAMFEFGNWARGEGRDYGLGFVEGIYQQIEQADKTASQDATGTALVVRSGEIALAKREHAKTWLKEDQGIKLYTSAPIGGTRTSMDANRLGRKHGSETDISSGRRRKLEG